MDSHKYSKTMNETLELKAICYAEVEHLSLEEALKKRIDDSLISAEVFMKSVAGKNRGNKRTKKILPK
jgi:hypothetical protein